MKILNETEINHVVGGVTVGLNRPGLAGSTAPRLPINGAELQGGPLRVTGVFELTR